MEIKEYQEKAARTLLNKSDKLLSLEETKIIWCSQGLAGEIGEVVDNLKKAIFHQHGINKEELKKELGDVLWYIAGLCTLLDFTLEEVMQLPSSRPFRDGEEDLALFSVFLPRGVFGFNVIKHK